jgi:hypothetical protein
MKPHMRSSDPVRWIERDRLRYRRDRSEVGAAFPDLVWTDGAAGGWDGTLPLWPFDRPAPDLLANVTGLDGLRMELRYPQAYPMVAPCITPLDPEPELLEWTVHGWHVNGDGTLCLLRSTALWDPRSSVLDLLLKAAGWRIEYALMKCGAIEAMTENGIVSSAIFDDLITEVGRQAQSDAQ